MPLRRLRRLFTPVGVELTDSTIADGGLHAAVMQVESRLRFLHPEDSLFAPTALRAAWLRLLLHRAEPAKGHMEHAEVASDKAAAATPQGHPLHPAALLLAATTAAIRAQYSTDLSVLLAADALVAFAEQAARQGKRKTAREAADLAAIGFDLEQVIIDCRHELGIAYRVHFAHTQDPEHAERAIEHLSVSDRDDMASLRSLTQLAVITRLRDRPGDLDDAIGLLGHVIAESPEGETDYPDRLITLGTMLAERFRLTGSLPDLEAAIQRISEGVAATPAGAPTLAARQAFLADLLVDRFLQTSQEADLDHGLAIARAAAEAATGPQRPDLLATYALKLLIAHDHRGDEELLHAFDAIAAEDLPVGFRIRSLIADSVRRSDAAGVDEAIRLLSASPAQPWRDLDLALALKLRFELAGDPADLERAIAGLTAIVDGPRGTMIEYLRVPVALVHLGQALLARYHVTGAAADLEAAIQRLRAAVAQCRPEHTAHPNAQAGLAGALLVRHLLRGTTSDLDEAIGAFQRAGKAGTSRLSQALLRRFELGGRWRDADDAVDDAWSAVAASPAIAGYRIGPLASFGSALLGRHSAAGDPADLDEAVTALTWAACLGNGQQRLPGFRRPGERAAASLANGQPRVTAELVRALTVRSGPADRDSAREHLTRLSDLDGHPDRGLVLLRWGQLLAAHDTPAAAYRRVWEAATDRLAPAPVRFEAATAAGATAARQDDSGGAAESYELAVELLPELAWRGLERRDQETWLIRTGGVGADAAAWAVRAHLPGRAVGLLESGRAVMWGQMVQLGTDLHDLSAAHPELAARLDAVRAAMRAREHREIVA